MVLFIEGGLIGPETLLYQKGRSSLCNKDSLLYDSLSDYTDRSLLGHP